MKLGRALSLVACVAGLAAAPARGATTPENPGVDEALAAEVDALRGEVATQIQLKAYDLLDEVVFGWTQHPPFGTPTAVVLADVTVPVGLGTGLQTLVENHFASLLINHPGTRMTLTHCPQCSAMIVHSGAKGTVISRGVDAPEVLEKAGWGSESRHAVFLDFEAEGSSLVLRVRITRLSKDLPVVFARALSSSSSSPALLRSPDSLVSAEDARKEYLDALAGRGLLLFPVRISVRNYASSPSERIAVPPYLWLQAGIEVGLSQARAWTAGFSVGYSWMPELHDGWMAQARMSRLISGRVRSLTGPDLYLFVSASMTSVYGPDAYLFRNEITDVTEILNIANKTPPRQAFGAWGLGLELRVKNRIGASFFLESLPALGSAPSLGNYLDLGLAKFQTLGAEVSFCF